MEKFKATDYQVKTYLEGMAGKMPLVSPDWKKLEQHPADDDPFPVDDDGAAEAASLAAQES